MDANHKAASKTEEQKIEAAKKEEKKAAEK